ncbi:MAG TPA: LytS/YhcK type 5TM receptor domain-containing protein [Thermoleophilia bacterium]
MDLNQSAFVSLVYNAALLLVLVFVYDLIARYLRHQSLSFKLLTGLVLGVISIAVMLAAWRLSSGVIFDTRSVVLSMGTLFYGTIPGLVAGAIAAVYRASRGGSGAVMGVSVIAMSVAVGALWRRWRHVARRDPSVLELYLFGLTVHVLMLALTSTLPDPFATLRQIALPVIVIYPLASVLLGVLMIDQRRRRRAERSLRESERRYRSLFEDSPVAMWEDDYSAVKAHLEALAAGGVGDVIAHLLEHPEEYERCVELSRTFDANKAAVRLFEADSREELLTRNSDIYRRVSDRGIHRFWAAMLKGETSATFEESNLSLKGREVYVLETCTVVPGH